MWPPTVIMGTLESLLVLAPSCWYLLLPANIASQQLSSSRLQHAEIHEMQGNQAKVATHNQPTW